MTTTLRAAVAALSLVAATAAHAASSGAAGVGSGDPFPFHAPGITVTNPPPYADTGSIAYPALAGRPSQVVTVGGPDGVPLTGSQAGVETANSLPRGFQEGTVAYAQQQSVQRYLAARQGGQPTRLARTRLAPSSNSRG